MKWVATHSAVFPAMVSIGLWLEGSEHTGSMSLCLTLILPRRRLSKNWRSWWKILNHFALYAVSLCFPREASASVSRIAVDWMMYTRHWDVWLVRPSDLVLFQDSLGSIERELLRSSFTEYLRVSRVHCNISPVLWGLCVTPRCCEDSASHPGVVRTLRRTRCCEDSASWRLCVAPGVVRTLRCTPVLWGLCVAPRCCEDSASHPVLWGLRVVRTLRCTPVLWELCVAPRCCEDSASQTLACYFRFFCRRSRSSLSGGRQPRAKLVLCESLLSLYRKSPAETAVLWVTRDMLNDSFFTVEKLGITFVLVLESCWLIDVCAVMTLIGQESVLLLLKRWSWLMRKNEILMGSFC
jgi:hypothetical protein